MEHTSTTRNTIKPRVALALTVLLAAASMLWFTAGPVEAHGTGLVKLCQRDGNPNSSGNTCADINGDGVADNAVFAACIPREDLTCDSVANGPRQLEIQLKNFPPNSNVHVWWIRGSQATNPAKTDCTTVSNPNGTAPGRTHLGDIATNGSGVGEQDDELPRSAWTLNVPVVNPSGEWDYGTNWVCATTAGHTPGSAGTVGDKSFIIYPTPF